MGEMGGLGILAFLFFLYAIHENCRRLQRTARSSEDAQVKLFGDLGRACQMALVLLLFNGLSGHNFQRYEWMWIAAFALLAAQFSAHRLKQEKPSAPTRGWKARGAT